MKGIECVYKLVTNDIIEALTHESPESERGEIFSLLMSYHMHNIE